MQPEYFELPEATDPTSSFRVSVTLQGGAKICKRDICLPSFLKLMSGQQYEMTFDEHPYEITRFDVDMALLHKSAGGRTAPSPGQTYPTTFVTGMPSAV